MLSRSTLTRIGRTALMRSSSRALPSWSMAMPSAPRRTGFGLLAFPGALDRVQDIAGLAGLRRLRQVRLFHLHDEGGHLDHLAGTLVAGKPDAGLAGDLLGDRIGAFRVVMIEDDE